MEVEEEKPGSTWITGLNGGHGEDRLMEWRVSTNRNDDDVIGGWV